MICLPLTTRLPQRGALVLAVATFGLGCGNSSKTCSRGQESVAGQCRSACAPGEERDPDGECRALADIAINSVGFLPEQAKLVAFTATDGEFAVIDAESGDEVFSATVSERTGEDSPDMGDEVFVGDFSTVTAPGKYLIRVADGDSSTFAIDEGLYEGVLQTTMLAFYGWRCGTAVEFEYAGDHFAHAKCHQADGILGSTYGERSGEQLDSTGGWHDAGDYGKYVNNGAFSVGLLLRAWEDFPEALSQVALDIPERGGDLPDLLDEVKWELDWLLTTQMPDGSVAHKVTARSFEGFIMPEADGAQRLFTGWSSESTATFAAVMAQAARVYEPFDENYAERCLDAAQAAYDFLSDHPEHHAPDDAGDFSTGGYLSGSDRDERLWAAAELWVTTGSEDALSDFEDGAYQNGSPSFRLDYDWADVANMGIHTYLLSDRAGRTREVHDALESAMLGGAERMVEHALGHGFGRALTAYRWGSNGILARTGVTLNAAYRLTGERRFFDALTMQIDHLLGRNFYRRSFVTGVGHNPPMKPHHRPSAADGVAAPWPGLLVGGSRDNTAQSWIDSQESYDTNEVAVNWSSSLAYLAAALLEAPADLPPLGAARASDASVGEPDSDTSNLDAGMTVLPL